MDYVYEGKYTNREFFYTFWSRRQDQKEYKQKSIIAIETLMEDLGVSWMAPNRSGNSDWTFTLLIKSSRILGWGHRFELFELPVEVGKV